ncbi:Starch-binding associating with outer membrane [Chitinophaga sp. CF118]|uniref:RagB/SusD family nutrient uptake outer membrane protein n=1 Tax=Chitinophaga sp. CF118 TaxID=1884367 RepID=UPI0008F3678F|nr:RagB/SusD family nutrient uptake outer membrane protein [Chitinophaga sp. CF118]SFE34249.1 Starch-binding associating with outer membrane [Chitinophaga sp. CF118]
MNKLLQHILFTFLMAGCLSACHDLDVPVESKLNPENFPKTQAQFILASGPVYTAFGNATLTREYWFLQSLSTDESILPARGGNWFDGSKYQQTHLHTWNPDNGNVGGAWSFLTTTISTCNQVLSTFANSAVVPDPQIVGEVKTMRALAYYFLMDSYGNVPVITTFGDTTQPGTTKRADVFAFIEKEVLDALPSLSTTVDASTYGRPTKYGAFALLAKMYLNATIYTGTERNADAVRMCDSIITAGKFALESNYRGMFAINNGPSIKEFIFAVPCTNSATQNSQTSGQFFARYYLHRAMKAKYSLPYTPSGAISIMPEYYSYFNQTGDVRNDIFLKGKQYDYSGKPIVISTTNIGYDASYSGSNPTAAYNYELDLTPAIVLTNVDNFDCGNDEKSWAEGYRCIKFYPDSTSTSRNQDNDFPIFRYADILLMKSEAILRGAAETNGQTALSLINNVRTIRNTAALGSVTLDDLYAERNREMVYEAWHRNDMIRFGKFEGSWGYKTDADVNHRIYPIPTFARALNPKLDQNPGY